MMKHKFIWAVVAGIAAGFFLRLTLSGSSFFASALFTPAYNAGTSLVSATTSNG